MNLNIIETIVITGILPLICGLVFFGLFWYKLYYLPEVKNKKSH